MDAVMAMEGNGPRSGDPVRMNVLLFSRDPIALDATACKIIDLPPEYVPTSQPGKEWSLGTYRDDEIELIGDPVGAFINRNFRIDRKPVTVLKSNNAASFVKNIVSSRPVIISERCKHCGVCVQVCPVNPKALNWPDNNKEKPPVYDYRKCIRCFCCQELCPEWAITIKTPLWGRILL
jgi:ferredoxin